MENNTNYIYIDTGFVRQSEPIFALAIFESKRRIPLSKIEDLNKPRSQVLAKVSNFVKNHYTTYIDGLYIWGQIKSYQLHLFNEIYQFDINGNLTDGDKIRESLATVNI